MGGGFLVLFSASSGVVFFFFAGPGGALLRKAVEGLYLAKVVHEGRCMYILAKRWHFLPVTYALQKSQCPSHTRNTSIFYTQAYPTSQFTIAFLYGLI